MSLGGIARVALGLAVAGRIVSAQPQEALPRFRADAALVQVDAYISKEGVSITDLRLEEVEVLEDDRPQEISNVSLVQPRRIPVATAISQPADGALVVLFFDTGHVSPENAERAHEQLSNTPLRTSSPPCPPPQRGFLPCALSAARSQESSLRSPSSFRPRLA